MLDKSFICCLTILLSTGLVFGETPIQIVVNRGRDVSLFCSTYSSFGFCEWKVQSKGTSCNIAKDGSSSGSCQNAPKVRWQTNATHCGITLSKVSPLEADLYSCKLFTPESVLESRSFELKVASKAEVSISQEDFKLNPMEDLNVDAGSTVNFECEASHGFPSPVISASIGKSDSTVVVELTPSPSTNTKNLDGSFSTKSIYSFVAKPEHCGLYLKCSSVQPDSTNLDHFALDGPNEVSVKIEVSYPPQPLSQPLQPFSFTQHSEVLSILIEFMSSPQPLDNQVVWYIDQNQGSGYLPIQSGGRQGRYYAHPIVSESHHTKAVLEIAKPSDVDVATNHYLEIVTNLGIQKYYFEVEKNENGAGHNPDHPTVEDEEEEAAEEKPVYLKTTIIIVIVIIVFVIVIGLVVLIWMKRQNKFCCQKHPDQHGETKDQKKVSLLQDQKEKDVEATNG